MTINLVQIIGIASIAIMLFCLYSTLALRKRVPGGIIGKKWNVLTILVVFFTIGYFTVPFFDRIPPEFTNVIVALIFLFGAIYVLITIRLIFSIITALTE